MKTILLIRHPETIDPARFYGSTDVGLSQKGEVQAARLCTRLISEKLNLVYASPMKRALHPAGLICQQGQITLVKETELKEINFGRWEGLTFDAIKKSQDGELLNQWIKEPEDFVFPEGEKVADFVARVKNAFQRIELDQSFKQKAAIITHGGVIRVFLCALLQKPLHYLWNIPQSFGAINVIEYRHRR